MPIKSIKLSYRLFRIFDRDMPYKLYITSSSIFKPDYECRYKNLETAEKDFKILSESLNNFNNNVDKLNEYNYKIKSESFKINIIN